MGQSTATDDFDRLMAGELIQRPTPRERTAGEWDWWRQQLPAADLIVSKVPMWHADTLRAAGIMREEP